MGDGMRSKGDNRALEKKTECTKISAISVAIGLCFLTLSVTNVIESTPRETRRVVQTNKATEIGKSS